MVFVLVFITLCHFNFSNHLDEEERELVAFLLLSFRCLVIVNVLLLFLKVPLVGLQCVIVVFPFPDHIHFIILSA